MSRRAQVCEAGGEGASWSSASLAGTPRRSRRSASRRPDRRGSRARARSSRPGAARARDRATRAGPCRAAACLRSRSAPPAPCPQPPQQPLGHRLQRGAVVDEESGPPHLRDVAGRGLPVVRARPRRHQRCHLRAVACDLPGEVAEGEVAGHDQRPGGAVAAGGAGACSQPASASRTATTPGAAPRLTTDARATRQGARRDAARPAPAGPPAGRTPLRRSPARAGPGRRRIPRWRRWAGRAPPRRVMASTLTAVPKAQPMRSRRGEPAAEDDAGERGHDEVGEDEQHAGDPHRAGHHDAERGIEEEVPPADGEALAVRGGRVGGDQEEGPPAEPVETAPIDGIEGGDLRTSCAASRRGCCPRACRADAPCRAACGRRRASRRRRTPRRPRR